MRVSLLICLVAASLLLTFATSVHADNHSNATVSPKLEAIIKADHHYITLLNRQSAVKKPASVLRSNTNKQQTSTAYSYQVASKMMWHSVTAYCSDDSSISNWNCASCNQFGSFHVTAVMDDTVNLGYVGYFTQGLPASPIGGVSASSPFVLVSFRGTLPSEISNWIEDLSASKFAAFSDAYPDVELHEGFWEGYQALKPAMMQGIQAALHASGANTILFAGHSLGGALAECAALDLKLNEYPSLHYASYTQGTPRVGNDAFAQLFESELNASFREIHNEDIVPHLPPKIMGFTHSPTEIWFTEDFSHYTTCSSSDGEDDNCSDSIAAPISIPDHLHYRGVDMGGYCDASAQAMRLGQLNTHELPRSTLKNLKKKKEKIILSEL